MHRTLGKHTKDTLLPQFLGMYRVSVDNEETYLIVMRNMFSHRLLVHRKYDLKGSLVAREASDKERGKELPTFKDMDFRNNMQKVYVTDEQKEKFMEKLNRDVEFLVKLKIMDYSLLLEVSNEEDPEAENGLAAGATAGSYGTSPEGIAGYMSAYKPLGPGEFDPYVDVYAVSNSRFVCHMLKQMCSEI
uniref:Phosphatidylinositol 5-phosphate 4-kinase type-2 gamma n=1 Tax=Labrus bergylta TaxID=56723 RepID=A0A3Q3F340_9LABR